MKTVPLVEKPTRWPETASDSVLKGMIDVLEGSALAARVETNGVWIFYEGGKFVTNRNPTKDQDKWAKIAAYRARDNAPTAARIFFTFEEMGDSFVQVGELDSNSGKITRYYEAIKFPRFI